MSRKPSKASRRAIYDQKYYRAKALLKEPWFQEKIAWLKKRYAEVGCPIPDNGFNTYKEFKRWYEILCEIRDTMNSSKEYKDGIFKITGGARKYSVEIARQVDDFNEQYLPPMYGEVFREIMEQYGVANDKKFRDFLEYYVFLGRDEFPTSPFRLRWIRDRKTDKMELFIQLLPHTKKEDITSAWDFITEHQRHLPGYMGKNKPWENFDRDMLIYSLHQEGLSDGEICGKISLEDHDLELSSIRKIISNTAKKLGHTSQDV